MSCSGFSATTIWMVEQFGLAMMLRSCEVAQRLAVHLRHDQRHVRVHAELRGVVDHHAARGRGAAARARPRPWRPGENSPMSKPSKSKSVEVLDLEQLLVAERDLRARRLLGGQRHDLVDRELALGQGLAASRADGAGGADDRDLVAHDGGPLSGGARHVGDAGRGGKGATPVRDAAHSKPQGPSGRRGSRRSGPGCRRRPPARRGRAGASARGPGERVRAACRRRARRPSPPPSRRRPNSTEGASAGRRTSVKRGRASASNSQSPPSRSASPYIM